MCAAARAVAAEGSTAVNVPARIGQLLGEAPGHGPGRGYVEKDTHADSLPRTGDRCDFRQLARGLRIGNRFYPHRRLREIAEKYRELIDELEDDSA